MFKEVDFLSLGEAFSLDHRPPAAEKAAPTNKKATAQACGWQVPGSQFTVEKAHLNR
jgi:hypothetical protein